MKNSQFSVLNLTPLEVPVVRITQVPSVSTPRKGQHRVYWMKRGSDFSACQMKAGQLLEVRSCKGHGIWFHSCLAAVASLASSVILLPWQPTGLLHMCIWFWGVDDYILYIYKNIYIIFSHSVNHRKLLQWGGFVVWVRWWQVPLIYFTLVTSYR